MYVLTSSLNYNSMMATHIIGTENYYKKRLYGANRFQKLSTDDNSELIRVFKEIPSNCEDLLIATEAEEYIVIIEINDYLEIVELEGKTYTRGQIYLDTSDHKILFRNEQEKKIVFIKSQVVLEVKEPIFYHPNKNNFILEDNVRNSLKGSCLMSEYISNKYNIEIAMCQYGITHSELDGTQLKELREYLDDVKELKRAHKNSLAENNINKLLDKWLKSIMNTDTRLMHNRLIKRDMSIDIIDIQSVVKRGVLLFLMKYNKIDELELMKTDHVAKSIALLLYGCYIGFSSLDRIIYNECKLDLFQGRWLHWLVYFYVPRNSMNQGLDNSNLAGLSAFD